MTVKASLVMLMGRSSSLFSDAVVVFSDHEASLVMGRSSSLFSDREGITCDGSQ